MLQAGAFATILNERGEVLLCHRPDVDLWNAPGGRVEVGESPWEAVVREIREETGVEAEVVAAGKRVVEARSQGDSVQFVGRIVAGQLSLTDECDAVAYVPLETLPEPLGPAFRSRLLQWSQNPDETAHITDDGPSTRELLERGLLGR